MEKTELETDFVRRPVVETIAEPQVPQPSE